MLIKLPNGDWVQPLYVNAIQFVEPIPEQKIGDIVIGGEPMQIQVSLDTGIRSCIVINDFTEAQVMIDNIAEQVNKSYQAMIVKGNDE